MLIGTFLQDGMSSEDVRMMVTDNPRRLLNLGQGGDGSGEETPTAPAIP
jgi:hypothetical protein